MMSQELLFEIVKGVSSALFGGALAAYLTIRIEEEKIKATYKKELKIKLDDAKEKERLEKEKLKVRYLDPLHLSAKILSDRINHIKNDYIKQDGGGYLSEEKQKLFYDSFIE
ncbi:hypothetical protein VU07_01255 [Desulfobulbus sp. F4]|nr:hypothetical protein [Desulfobulbus sp. F3]MCW5200432.1 hypothetical protein [Desulfobulbus sp. F4]